MQLSTYGAVFEAQLDPMWTAVTGYYAAFMGATALLTAVGRATRTFVHGIGPITRGIHVFTTEPSAYPGRILLVIQKGGATSHRSVWVSLVERLKALSMIDPSDAWTNRVLDSLCNLIQRPDWLSDFRNRINYSIDVDPALAMTWTSELRTLTVRDRVDGRLATAGSIRDEQRLELVALACGSLLSALYADYKSRANRPDPRPQNWRRTHLKRADPNDLEQSISSHVLR